MLRKAYSVFICDIEHSLRKTTSHSRAVFNFKKQFRHITFSRFDVSDWLCAVRNVNLGCFMSNKNKVCIKKQRTRLT